MKLIFTGPQRDAVILHRILREDDIEAVCMTGTDDPSGAVFVPPDAAEDAQPAIDRAIRRMHIERDSKGDDNVNESTFKRAPDALYWRAWEAIRAAHGRLQQYEETRSPFEPDDVELAAAEGLAKLATILKAIENQHGTCRIAVEGATEKALALLTGMRAIALVMRNPLADSRGEISDSDPDKRFEATAAVGFLLLLLHELATEDAPERWMSEDARGLLPGEPDNTEGGSS